MRTPEKFKFSDYRADDFEELWRVDQECFPAGIAYSKEELAAYIHHAKAFTLIARGKDGTVAGFIVAEPDPANIGRILTIDILPKYQRFKLGSELLKLAEERLRHAKCRSILLEVAVNNFPALTFYKHHGYHVLETIPRYYLDSIDALVMGKHLNPAPKR